MHIKINTSKKIGKYSTVLRTEITCLMHEIDQRVMELQKTRGLSLNCNNNVASMEDVELHKLAYELHMENTHLTVKRIATKISEEY